MLIIIHIVFIPGSGSAQPAAVHWALDPSIPGADLPPTGVSAFDRVTIGPDGRQQIPFPFERLVQHIEDAAGCETAQPCTRSVLIPLGRSLQRLTAAPDYFEHPRVVTAVVGEGTAALLRDRLFLGFQDKTGVIEVISYNEPLGRFEFQIVKNYTAGKTPEVIYARRTVCIACHQNQGPIFSQPVWLETNANPKVAARLREQRNAFAGVDASGNTDIAQAIDDATDRANRLALTQRLWIQGCGGAEAGARCRRAALAASLQFALNGRRSYAQTAQFARDITGVLTRNAATYWPGGLALASADIPNRDPLDLHAGVTALAVADIATRFDPLAPRAPLEILTSDARLEDRLVRGIADFWPQRSLNALADAMESHRGSSVHRMKMACRVSGAAGVERFDCGDGSSRMRGSLHGATGTIEEVAAGADEPVRHLPIGSVHRQPGEVSFNVRDGARAARLANGNSLQQVFLKWIAPEGNGAATLTVREDFAALAEVVANIDMPPTPLASGLVDRLSAALAGHDAPHERELHPLVAADSYAPSRGQTDTLARQFESQCGACHHTQETTPPNFLSGDARRVASALRSCAPRIFARLAMRNIPAGQRVKSPMPPQMPTLATDSSASDEHALVELQSAAGRIIDKEYGRPVSLEELTRSGYESLPPCLPLPAADRETTHGRTAT